MITARCKPFLRHAVTGITNNTDPDQPQPGRLIADSFGNALLALVAGVAVQVAAAYLLGRSSGADPLTIVELVKQSQARLLAGGMHGVRPDLDTD